MFILKGLTLLELLSVLLKGKFVIASLQLVSHVCTAGEALPKRTDNDSDVTSNSSAVTTVEHNKDDVIVQGGGKEVEWWDHRERGGHLVLLDKLDYQETLERLDNWTNWTTR